jgi:hypothetical protein
MLVDGVGEAAPATPFDVYVILLSPRCFGFVSDAMVEHEGFV